MKRLLLIDDHPIMRHGLAQLIRAEDGLDVCGEAGNARDGLTAVGELKPDLVVIDLTLPDKNGLELLKDIQAQFPGTLCLVLSMHDETMYGERALRAGARGYIMKEAAADHLITAARKVLSGGIYVSDSMTSRMMEQVVGHRAKAASLESLTDRELEVLEMIGQGVATKNIAERLCISARTVEAHRAHIKDKLAITEGAALVRYAVQWVQGRAKV
ncbi:response regulator transcription factor [Prosthecobacter dejongeii]|uniref:DNA-binding NarL/FixJ family response regulator n=1 Tax=Prosthecobacter dejongeii TaxID=48465 RepID=A0A7W7YLS3_9BACT|nr:response regulator transcription factor [Prosthecobacter dejongeii]MBB5038560.1 DNA-binding NarL/FixJ family response regulator [Prosthecobacter dejongeii]